MLRLFIPHQLLTFSSGYLLGWHDAAASYQQQLDNGAQNVTTTIVWAISKFPKEDEDGRRFPRPVNIGMFIGVFENPSYQTVSSKNVEPNNELWIHLRLTEFGQIDVGNLTIRGRLLEPSRDCHIFLFQPSSYTCLMPEVLRTFALKDVALQSDPPQGDGCHNRKTQRRPNLLAMFATSLTEFQHSAVADIGPVIDFSVRGNGLGLKFNAKTALTSSASSIVSRSAAILNCVTQTGIISRVLKYGSRVSTFASQIQTRTLQLQYLTNRTTANQNSLSYWNTFGAIWLDVVIGTLLAFLLYRTLPPTSMLDYFLDCTSVIVGNLQVLLYWLMGVPAGLKLNQPLSSAMGTFFLFHIYLWEAYLDLLKPLLSFMLALASYCGIFGFTFQLSMLQDLVALATFHIYCFYAYAARIYNINYMGLGSTWRLFRGKKWNPLRQRVDSCTYEVDQLFIGALCFTVLLFLLPTSLLYYAVFSVLRLIVLIIQGLIQKVICGITHTPLYTLILYAFRSRCLITNVTLAVLREQVCSNRPVLFLAKANICSFRTAILDFLPLLPHSQHRLTWERK